MEESAGGSRGPDAELGPDREVGGDGGPRQAGASGTESGGSAVASFVMRFSQDLWRDAGGSPRVRWRGHIRHVQSDDEARFTELAEALSFIQARLARLTLDAVADQSEDDRREALDDSLKLWERFAEDYSGLMVDTMRRTLRQTDEARRALGEAFERSLRAWGVVPPGSSGSGGSGGSGGKGGSGRGAGQPAGQGRGQAGADRETAAPRRAAGTGAVDESAILDAIRGLSAQLEDLGARVSRIEGGGNRPLPGTSSGAESGQSDADV